MMASFMKNEPVVGSLSMPGPKREGAPGKVEFLNGYILFKVPRDLFLLFVIDAK